MTIKWIITIETYVVSNKKFKFALGASSDDDDIIDSAFGIHCEN